MLNTFITRERITLRDSVSSWTDAIDAVCEPLIKDGSISPEYIDAIIQSTRDLGPYYVLGPGIAMPHARPEQGVNCNGLALLIVRHGVEFHSEENDPVKLILLLAAKDSSQHIELIRSISEFFCNDMDVQNVINALNVEDIIKVISKY